ncbi:MAG: hypothetical protein KJ060_03405 [Candidatus Hydrogenedentes bacterium]|nr:hypothetical protein [Candidatus Hydrogenedentota bacterium]
MTTERMVVIICFAGSLVLAGGFALIYGRGDSPAKDALVAAVEAPLVQPTPLAAESPVSDAPEPRPEAAAQELAAITPGDGPPTVIVTDKVLIPGVKRFGINLGGRTQYGAAQIIKNIIPNPGFEPGLYGSMLHVEKGASGDRLPQAFWDVAWNHEEYGIGQPEGFWNGADYEIVFGPAKGRSGTVKRFTHEEGKNVFYLDESGTAPQEYDAFIVRQELPGVATGSFMNTSTVDVGEVRPGSPGTQSLRLDSSGRWYLYLDSYWRDGDTSAGKLLLIEGPWRLSFWAKGEGSGSRLRVRFQRDGEAVFIDEVVPLSAEWKEYSFSFDAAGQDMSGPYPEGASQPILTLGIAVEAGGAWIDDTSLQRTDDANPTVFVDALVDAYKELRPGVLRNWSTQLGDTLDNQLAEPWARKEVGFSPRFRASNNFCFSLHEFLELCAIVDAEPWYVIPPTFSQEDCLGLVEYLASPADGAHPYADWRRGLGQEAPWTEVFNEIHLEFGNEMWGAASGGDPFFGASALGGDRLGTIAGDRFAAMQRSPAFADDKIDLIIGGQYYFPGRQQEIQRSSSAHDAVALAPYFGELGEYGSAADRYGPLFARPFAAGRLQESMGYLRAGGRDTAMAIYEINFHTTGGEIPYDVRNDFVTGADGALALPLYMLVYLRDFAARDQCAFTTLQYSFDMGGKNYVRLWGLLRDIAATGRKRPTWLGLELVNRAVAGDLLETRQSGIPVRVQKPINGVEEETNVPLVQSFAFRDGEAGGVVLFNLDLENAIEVNLQLPPGASGLEGHRIAPSSLSDDNEDSEQVRIEPLSRDALDALANLELPRHSLTVLQWREL